jgi:hypothetical protein
VRQKLFEMLSLYYENITWLRGYKMWWYLNELR